tara:strand:- start:287 stop:1531 length:1245 start_codon:yes stop_codon:yes gene_type:complete
MTNMSNILLIIFLSTIGVDRITLMPDASFSFTPFILMSFFLLVFIILFKRNDLDFKWILSNKSLLLSFSLFIIFVIISILFSVNINFSFKRFCLLLLIITVIILILSSNPIKDLYRNIFFGSIFGSILFYIFNIFLLLHWLDVLKFNSNIIDLEPHTLSYFIPRLGGFSSDVNRGGFILIFYTYYLLTYKSKNEIIKNIIIFINIFFILCTLSRTSYLFLLVTFFFYMFYFISRNKRIIYSGYLLLTLLITLLIANYFSSKGIINFSEVIKERISFENKGHDSSSSIHFKLIEDGVDVLSSDFKIFLLGNGHGTSYDVIKGYRMSKDKNANFHSQYISVFVENGLFAFISFLFLTLLIPIMSTKNIFLPIVLGIFFFNIFYQLLNEPLYWFILLFFYFIDYSLNYKSRANENIY